LASVLRLYSLWGHPSEPRQVGIQPLGADQGTASGSASAATAQNIVIVGGEHQDTTLLIVIDILGAARQTATAAR
jgi:hypothetical protein